MIQTFFYPKVLRTADYKEIIFPSGKRHSSYSYSSPKRKYNQLGCNKQAVYNQLPKTLDDLEANQGREIKKSH